MLLIDATGMFIIIVLVMIIKYTQAHPHTYKTTTPQGETMSFSIPFFKGIHFSSFRNNGSGDDDGNNVAY